jgi:hypothetical protein
MITLANVTSCIPNFSIIKNIELFQLQMKDTTLSYWKMDTFIKLLENNTVK